MHDFGFLLLQLHNRWFKIKKIFESRTVDTVHVPLSPYRMLFLTNITVHHLSYSNWTLDSIFSLHSSVYRIVYESRFGDLNPYLRFLSFHILCAGPAL